MKKLTGSPDSKGSSRNCRYANSTPQPRRNDAERDGHRHGGSEILSKSKRRRRGPMRSAVERTDPMATEEIPTAIASVSINKSPTRRSPMPHAAASSLLRELNMRGR